MNLFNRLFQETNDLVNRGLDRHLRLAVTGLSRSGKTAFITSLMDQLLHLDRNSYKHLPLFTAARKQQIIAVQRLPQENLSLPRFSYEENRRRLEQNPPIWAESTTNLSETRLAIRFQRENGLLSLVQDTGTLYLEIFDYPGEWLLDLPLLQLDFQQWSEKLQNLAPHFISSYNSEGQKWQSKLQQLDLTAPVDEIVLQDIAEAYTAFLHQCKAQGMNLIQPGRFVLPGALKGSPALQFFPLLHLSSSQWQQLQQKANKNSNFAMLQKRYEYYRKRIVKGFYDDYFQHFDRQVILADCLTPLNHSHKAFLDTSNALNLLFQNFHYGNHNLWNRLFSPRIDKLMFIATKADHITSDQLPNLVSLLRQLVQEGGRYVEFEGVKTDYATIAAIRATKQVQVQENGKLYKAIQGIPIGQNEPIVQFSGSVPTSLPQASFWDKQTFAFDQFNPSPLNPNEPIPHLKMDTVLEFLLGDKLK